MQTLIIDNYDSYTYNLYQLVWSVSGIRPIIIKNDELTYSEVLNLKFDNVIISPGPGSPDKHEDFGVCKDIIKNLDKPILGVCLGHQGIGYYFGSKVVRAEECFHGRTSVVEHDGTGIFKNIPSPFRVMRYHSLVVEDTSEELNITATTNNIIMGVEHKTKPVFGVQFHPESIATEYGAKIIENFNEITKEFYPHIKYKKLGLEIDDTTLFDTLHAMDEEIIWLDSSKIIKDDSRYSIFAISSKRSHILKYYSEERKINITGNINEELNMSLFDYLDDFYNNNDNDLDIPFSLGYVGYLGYELKGETSGEYYHKNDYPDAILKFADRAVIKDHLTEEIILVYYSDDEFSIDNPVKNEIKFNNDELPSYSLEVNKDKYISDIKKCLNYIKQGESYEICLTNRLIIEKKLDAVDYYKCLREVSPSQYGALLLFDDLQICSSSMERFLKINSDRIVSTKPIKGTLPRGKCKEEDDKFINILKNDERFHSENLMIVDLLRNDLGMICKKDSVKVTKLLDVESFKTLHQLVSTVEGELLENKTIMDCIKATFPGGSMTGAPKKRTMSIIDKLEKSSRGVYSGTIGYFSLNKNVDLSIVIRTSIIEENKTTIGIGGAIIDLSNPLEEYEEILLKASGSLKALKMYYNK